MKIGQLMESRIDAMRAERAQLVERYNPLISAASSYLKKEGKELSPEMAGNIARCCESAILNAAQSKRSRIFETTDSSNIDFLGIQLPVIAALLPSLALNELATVQALERRTGGIFFLDVKYGTTKGAISSGSKMMDSKTGHNSTLSGRRYASQRVENETLCTGGGVQEKTGTLDYLPVVAGSVIITDGTETLTDDGEGVLVSDASEGAGGTVDYTTGAVSVTFATTPGDVIYADYKYNYETKTTSEVPEVNFDVTYETVTAEDFPLRANYTLASAIDLERAHGISLEDEVVKYLGAEVKFTMDHLGIDLMLDAAQGTGSATTPGEFSATVGSGQEWIWKKFQFLDFVEKANVNIIQKTKRMMCTWIVVGSDAARLIRQLAPNFVPASDLNSAAITGPHVMGKLDGRTVVYDPFVDADAVMFGWKGDSFVQAGFVLAPYIPLLTTPTLVTADLKAQKGFLSSAAYKTVNAGSMCYGTIAGLA